MVGQAQRQRKSERERERKKETQIEIDRISENVCVNDKLYTFLVSIFFFIQLDFYAQLNENIGLIIN